MRLLLVALTLATLTGGCARIEEKLNQVSREWDNSEKVVTLYSLDGTAVKTYDIGRSKVTRAPGDGGYVYFYAHGKYVQTSLPYVVESK